MSSLNLDHWLGELGGLQEATPTPLPSTDSDCPSPEGRTGLSTSSQSQLGRLQGLWAQTSGPRDSRLGRTSQPRPVFVGGNTKIKSPSGECVWDSESASPAHPPTHLLYEGQPCPPRLQPPPCLVPLRAVVVAQVLGVSWRHVPLHRYLLVLDDTPGTQSLPNRAGNTAPAS